MKNVHIHIGRKSKDADPKQIDDKDWNQAIDLLRQASAALDKARQFINSKPEMRDNHQLQKYLAQGGTIGRR